MSGPRSHADRGQLFGTDGHGTYWQEQTMDQAERHETRHVHGPACMSDTEGPTILWLCGYAPFSTPKPDAGA